MGTICAHLGHKVNAYVCPFRPLRARAQIGPNKPMANNLKALREMRGWTQEHLAGLMGTTRDMYVKLERGGPGGRRLSDKWIARASEAFGVDAGEIVTDKPLDANGDAPPPTRERDEIDELDARAGLGGGGVPTMDVRRDGNHADAVKSDRWKFPPEFLHYELRAPASRLIVLETIGDSMFPTIGPSERVIVDTGHKAPSPDGIYALRDQFGGMIVKRLQVLRRGEPPVVRVISDNPAHDAEEVGLDEIEIIGRVLFGMRRF